MNRRGLCHTFAVVFGVVVLCTPTSCQVQERQENPAYVRYRRILDLVFPRKESGRLSLFLRIAPTSSPDFQVALIDRGDEVYQVILYSLRDSRRSVAEQANDINLRTGETDATRIAEQIPVRIEPVNVPAEVVQGWMQEFSRIKFSPVLLSPHVLDGTQYELWSSTHTSAAFYFSLATPSVIDEKTHPLVRWMNKVANGTKAYALTQVSNEGLILPGERVGGLRLGDARGKVLSLFPFKKTNDAEYSYGFCEPHSEIHWLDMGDGVYEISFFLRDGRVFQIESATTRFATKEGFTLYSAPELVRDSYPGLKSYVLTGSGSDEVGGRDLVYWVDADKGIAFEFRYAKKKQRRLLYKVIIFQRGSEFRPQGCVTPPREWRKLPPYSLEPLD